MIEEEIISLPSTTNKNAKKICVQINDIDMHDVIMRKGRVKIIEVWDKRICLQVLLLC